jgi:type IV pilus assembly protein PilM
MNLNKEIKLSELFKRSEKTKTKKPSGRSHKPAKAKKSKKQEIVGLKLGASQIAAARVQNDGSGNAKLMQLARAPLAPGIVAGGEVRDIEALGAALNKFFADNKLPRTGIRLGIATNRVGVRTLDVEGIDDERQLGNAVRFRAHEALSIPMDQAVLDYHVIGETIDETGAVSRRVILAAAYRDPIDHYVQACRIGKLQLSGIDLEAFALLRAVQQPHSSLNGSGPETPSALVALSLGHDRAILAISDGTVCELTRVLEWGGRRLEAAIERDLGFTPEEAAEMKLHVSIEADAASVDDDPRVAKARTAVLREVQTLARELIASLQFYQSQPNSLPISQVLVTGGTSRLPGLAEELERLTRARVRLADPLLAVDGNGTLGARDDIASLAVAIGLGIER